MKQLIRIATWVGHPPLGTPQQLLEKGSAVYELGDKVRLYALRKVAYDDDMNPVCASRFPFERQFQSLDELYAWHSLDVLSVVDVDNHLKVYDDERN
jgi:hypothetical protein